MFYSKIVKKLNGIYYFCEIRNHNLQWCNKNGHTGICSILFNSWVLHYTDWIPNRTELIAQLDHTRMCRINNWRISQGDRCLEKSSSGVNFILSFFFFCPASPFLSLPCFFCSFCLLASSFLLNTHLLLHCFVNFTSLVIRRLFGLNYIE